MGERVEAARAAAPRRLVFRAEVAQKAGVAFYEGNEKVWLADLVPPEFIG